MLSNSGNQKAVVTMQQGRQDIEKFLRHENDCILLGPDSLVKGSNLQNIVPFAFEISTRKCRGQKNSSFESMTNVTPENRAVRKAHAVNPIFLVVISSITLAPQCETCSTGLLPALHRTRGSMKGQTECTISKISVRHRNYSMKS